MLEKAVLDGKALQLWELPIRLHDNEEMLREFFLRHFDRTPAARIKTVAYSKAGCMKTNRNSRCVGGEVTVEFFDVGGVELVLSKIIQHELLERDEANHMELRRGYVYLGHDRLLVEGVVFLLQSSSAVAVNREAACGSVGGGAHRRRSPAAHGIDAVMKRMGNALGDDTDNDRLQKGVVHGSVWDSGKKQQHDDDDDDGGGGNMSEERLEVKRGTSLQATPTTSGTGVVVLCMTFVCTFDRHRRADAPLQDDEKEYGVTPHVIFQLLRGTCFVRKVVLFRRELEGKGNAKRRIVRALVEVGGEEEANSVVKTFHATTLELAGGEPGSEEVEYRCRVYARYNNGQHANRQLSVPVNTDKSLSVTPHNLCLMGPMFRRNKHDRDACADDGDDDASSNNAEQGREQSRSRCERSNRERHGCRLRRHSNERRSSGSRRRRSRSREHQSPQRHRNHNHRRHHRHRSVSTERPQREHHHHHRRKHELASAMEGEGGAGDHYGYHRHSYIGEQQQQQQHLTNQTALHPALCASSIAASEHAVAGHTLPPGWRAVFSDQYQRVYYVYRDPATGVEVSSWEVTPLQQRC